MASMTPLDRVQHFLIGKDNDQSSLNLLEHPARNILISEGYGQQQFL